PHNRPASRSQSFLASSKYRLTTWGWTCASAAVAAPSSTSRNSAFKSCRVCVVIFPSARAYPQTIAWRARARPSRSGTGTLYTQQHLNKTQPDLSEKSQTGGLSVMAIPWAKVKTFVATYVTLGRSFEQRDELLFRLIVEL